MTLRPYCTHCDDRAPVPCTCQAGDTLVDRILYGCIALGAILMTISAFAQWMAR
jgi:hypothetical protein